MAEFSKGQGNRVPKASGRHSGRLLSGPAELGCPADLSHLYDGHMTENYAVEAALVLGFSCCSHSGHL